MGKDRKRKQFVNNSDKNCKRYKENRKLTAGMCGMLITHDRNRDRSCTQDAFNVLNFFYEKWYKNAAASDDDVSEADNNSEDDDEEVLDIANALASEVKEHKGKVDEKFNFYSLNSGCNNILFIKTNFSPPLLPSIFVQRIFEFFNTSVRNELTDVPFVKNVLRIHPIDKSCSANLADIRKMLEGYLPQALQQFEESKEDNGNEFCVVFKRRNQDVVRQNDAIETIIAISNEKLDKWFYNCRSENVFLIIDIIGGVCCTSVVKDYFRLHKFNMRETVNRLVSTEQNKFMLKKPINLPKDNGSNGLKPTNNTLSQAAADIYNAAFKVE